MKKVFLSCLSLKRPLNTGTMKSLALWLLLITALNCTATATTASPTSPQPAESYDIGQPILTDIYVSPSGSNSNSGQSPTTPLKTITAAWAQIPTGTLTGTGYRINLLPGTYPCEPAEPDDCRNGFGDRHGTAQYPIIIRAYGSRPTIRGGFDLANLSYFYLIDLNLVGGGALPTNQSGNNLLHLYNSDHVLLRRVNVEGPNCDTDSCNNLQETFKVNQVQYLYLEDSTLGGAWHTVVDYFSVQYGHLLNNHLHTAGQWCIYIKGGTSYLRLEGNELERCALGFQAGQSSNLTVMRSPWLHYEAYDIKFVNNLLHDLPGVGLSVTGGYNILFAYNTLYRVGTSTGTGYPLINTAPGERGCNATDEIPSPVPVCTTLTGQGAWGPNILTDNLPAIPNRNIYIYNNLIYNPPPSQTQYTHLSVAAPLALPTGFQNLPATIASDQNLVIAGNFIWNGPTDHPWGIDETTGCPPGNPTCNPTQLTLSNTLNLTEPRLIAPEAGNYHPAAGSAIFSATVYPIPDFSWTTFTPTVPAGTLTNTVAVDRDGRSRGQTGPAGAYVGNNNSLGHFLYLPLVLRAGLGLR